MQKSALETQLEEVDRHQRATLRLLAMQPQTKVLSFHRNAQQQRCLLWARRDRPQELAHDPQTASIPRSMQSAAQYDDVWKALLTVVSYLLWPPDPKKVEETNHEFNYKDESKRGFYSPKVISRNPRIDQDSPKSERASPQ